MVGRGQLAILCHVAAEAEHVKIAILMDIFTHFFLLEVCRDRESFCSWPQLDQSRSQLRGMVESPLQQHLKQNNSTCCHLMLKLIIGHKIIQQTLDPR